eukprot:g2556.t1
MDSRNINSLNNNSSSKMVMPEENLFDLNEERRAIEDIHFDVQHEVIQTDGGADGEGKGMELWIKLPKTIHLDDLHYNTVPSSYTDAIDLEVSGRVSPSIEQMTLYRGWVKKYGRAQANSMKKFGPFKVVFHVGNEMDLDNARVRESNSGWLRLFLPLKRSAADVWEVHFTERGERFYWNPVTGQSSWNLPRNARTSGAKMPPSGGGGPNHSRWRNQSRNMWG